MASNEKTPIDSDRVGSIAGHKVHFDDNIYTNQDSPSVIPVNDNNNAGLFPTDQPNREKKNRGKTGILRRRENTLTTADAPPIILSDEGLKAGRVSPFINFPLFLSMTIRSVGVIFGDM
jgi:hypothetical protein